MLSQDESTASAKSTANSAASTWPSRRLDDARRELAIYTERREYDPEGLYYYGQVLERSRRHRRARELYARAVEADRTAPRYRRRFTARWSRLAQKQLGRLPVLA